MRKRNPVNAMSFFMMYFPNNYFTTITPFMMVQWPGKLQI
jgi:hypothetical protein